MRTRRPGALARELQRGVGDTTDAAEGMLRGTAAAASRPRLDSEEEEDEEPELLDDERGVLPRLFFFDPASRFAPTAGSVAGWEGAAGTGANSLESEAPAAGAASAGAVAEWE